MSDCQCKCVLRTICTNMLNKFMISINSITVIKRKKGPIICSTVSINYTYILKSKDYSRVPNNRAVGNNRVGWNVTKNL